MALQRCSDLTKPKSKDFRFLKGRWFLFCAGPESHTAEPGLRCGLALGDLPGRVVERPRVFWSVWENTQGELAEPEASVFALYVL